MELVRTETKFIINAQERLQLLRRLTPLLHRDTHADGSGGYEVRSLYFDTLDDRCCREKDDGLQVHEKIRARIYGADGSVIKLESKRKEGERQTKRTMVIDRDVLEALQAGSYGALLRLQDPKAVWFYERLSDGMFPKVIIRYQRLALYRETNDIRITFDSDIRATESSLDLLRQPLLARPILPPGLTVLEVKYNHFLLDYIKDALSGLQQSPGSYSKYMNGRVYY